MSPILLQAYDCVCYTGYNGLECQYDIDECASSPCQYNGTCYQRSVESHYLDGTKGFENLIFSYATAAGYVCNCIDGITGKNYFATYAFIEHLKSR